MLAKIHALGRVSIEDDLKVADTGLGELDAGTQ
jgi:hypothetical protein